MKRTHKHSEYDIAVVKAAIRKYTPLGHTDNEIVNGLQKIQGLKSGGISITREALRQLRLSMGVDSIHAGKIRAKDRLGIPQIILEELRKFGFNPEKTIENQRIYYNKFEKLWNDPNLSNIEVGKALGLGPRAPWEQASRLRQFRLDHPELQLQKLDENRLVAKRKSKKVGVGTDAQLIEPEDETLSPIRGKDGELAAQVLAFVGRKGNRVAILTEGIVQERLKRSKATVKRALGAMTTANILGVFEDPSGENIYLVRRLPRKSTKKKWVEFPYSAYEIIDNLHTRYIDRVGAYLQQALLEKSTVTCSSKYLKEVAKKIDIPAEIFEQIIRAFSESGAITLRENVVHPPHTKRVPAPTHASLRAYVAAHRSLPEKETGNKPPINSWATLTKLYEDHANASRILRIPITTGKPTISVLNLSELRVGHQDFSIEMFNKILHLLENNPDMLPDVIVVSGLVEGSFQFSLTNRRRHLVPGVTKESEQFAFAKECVLDRLMKLGCLIVYSMGHEDSEIIKSRTVEAVQLMEGILRSSSRPVDWKDRLWAQRSGLWDFHLQFQAQYVFPYMLRTGRTLRSTETMAEMFSQDEAGKDPLHMAEYLLLLEAHQQIESGRPISPLCRKALELTHFISRKAEDLERQRQTGLIVTHNCEIVGVLPSGKEIRLLTKHYQALTPVTLPQDPTKAMRAYLAHMRATGESGYDAVLLTRYLQSLMICGGEEKETFVIATPGMQQGCLTWDGLHDGASSDQSHRAATTRRDRVLPGAVAHTFAEDGSLRVRFLTRGLLDRCDSSTKRSAVALFTDWQTSSITMRPDLQVSFLSYVLHDIAPVLPTSLFFGGDISHARNYPGAPNESGTATRLIRIDHQTAFTGTWMEYLLSHVPPDALKNIINILTVPGNHEWNSGYPWSGAVYTDFLGQVFRLAFVRAGIEGVRPIACDHITTGRGDRMHTFTGTTKVAGYGFLLQHMFLERGGKGSGGTPILQAKTLLEGVGGLLSKTDVALAGHWHHPQYTVIDDILFAISGSLAGLSGWEWMRAHVPVIGALVVYVGGGEPVEIEFLSHRRLATMKVQGYFSDAHLASLGYHSDEEHDPLHSGFVRTGTKLNAVKHALWSIVDEITDATQSRLP